MRLQIDGQSGALCLTVKELSNFAQNKGRDLAAMGFLPGAMVETALADSGAFVERSVGTFVCRVEADAKLSKTDGVLSVQTDKVLPRAVTKERFFSDPAFVAQGMLNGYIAAAGQDCAAVRVILSVTSEKTGESMTYEKKFPTENLCQVFEHLFSRAAPFIEVEGVRQTRGRADLAVLRFPYATIREGQRDFIEATYRAIKRHQRLLVSAPTGIGKTMSSVYPALRSVGAGLCDRVFYFTAKTVTGNAALDAVRTLANEAPVLRCIRITAKERSCPVRRGEPSLVTNCRKCAFTGYYEGVSYEERRDRALLTLLTKGRVYDTADVENVAATYHLCPYELSLDLSEYCEMIVADYGYLLDTNVRFRRYFEEERGEKQVFLVDEAHNVPDRAREMYSATLTRAEFTAFAENARASFPDDTELREALCGVETMFSAISALCKKNGEMRDEEGVVGGCILEKEVPPFVPDAAVRLRTVCYQYLRRDYEGAMPLFGGMWTAIRSFTDAILRMDERFAFYGEDGPDNTVCRVLCLDPARMLHEAFQKGESTVFFSATLSPMEYYADVCGSPDAMKLDLPSPFPKENLCLVTVDSVSTRFSQRKQSYDDVAELITAVTEARPGNYIVYFPSYAYMNAVCRRYLALCPDGRTIMQKQGMSLTERNRFLKMFSAAEAKGESLVAFCVLGGIFSEGIDLAGEKLIGTLIVGMGLPGLSSELNILTEYYDRTRESGREYAYVYPAMNKILQAAGRVIRGEEDRGVVVLLDDRYADPAIRRLFPAHWERMQYTGDPLSLSRILERFWEEDM